MSGISTHVLDTALGRPAVGIAVTLEHKSDRWDSVTDANGRVASLLPEGEPVRTGIYRILFQTNGPFFPEVVIQFRIDDPASHYHVPLLLSPYGYTTYRGS